MPQLSETQSPQPPQYGVLLLHGLILLLFCVFAFRFWYLQIHKGGQFAEKARDNSLRQELVYAPRGLVRDVNGKLLAVNEPAYALGLIREDCPDVNATLDMVSQWTGEDFARLHDIYEKARKKVKPFEPIILSRDMSFESLAKIEAQSLRWPGLEIVVRPRRKYMHGKLMAHILGYVAEANEEELAADSSLALGDIVGKQGLELVLEDRLRGKKGSRQIEVDATGRRLNEMVINYPAAGWDVRLSIDLGLQEYTAKLLEGEAGSVVVMDPDTGKILAFVSAPSYDSNDFAAGLSNEQWKELRDDPMHPLQNRVIQSVYPPGSVFKLVVAGAGLKDNIDPAETVWCPGFLKYGRRVFRCWKRGGHGHTDLKKALVESCDVYFYKLGDRLGVDKMSDFAFKCGFGKPTGIDLPHEKSGNIPTRQWKRKRYGERWQGGENLNMAIGQGFVLVSPLQVARFLGALINGGHLMKPLLLADEKPRVLGDIPLTRNQIKLITDAMVATVDGQHGTARRLRMKGVTIGAKTGTAQVVNLTKELEKLKDKDIPYKYRDHAWMASWGMRGDKKYVVVAMVEHGLHGGSRAGPVVRSVYKYLFPEIKEKGNNKP